MESSSQTIDKVKLEQKDRQIDRQIDIQIDRQIDKENDCLPENYIF